MGVLYLTPVGGKSHSFTCNGNQVPLAKFDQPLKAPYIECNNFNQFPFGITGIEGGEISFAGKINATAGANWSQAPTSIRIGNTLSVIANFNTLLKMTMSILVTDVQNTGDINGAGEFSGKGQLQGPQQATPGSPVPPNWYCGDT